MREIKVKGTYHILGRGKIFTADERDHDFSLRSLRSGDRINANEVEWQVVHLEMFSHCKVIGICVKKVNNGL